MRREATHVLRVVAGVLGVAAFILFLFYVLMHSPAY